MRAGFIGAGRVGFSLGKYLTGREIEVPGYYDHTPVHAAEAAEFTGTKAFSGVLRLAEESDLLFITTPDGKIRDAWEELLAAAVRGESERQTDCTRGDGEAQADRIRQGSVMQNFPLAGKILCHCSGSLTSEVFAGIEETGAAACSLHPMLAFSDRYTSYRQLDGAFFTVEGDAKAVAQVTELFTGLGNRVCPIEREAKGLYHAAASILSNQVVAVLDTGYRLLARCGFSGEDARSATEALVRGNVDHVIREGCVRALTGPIERADARTVRRHLECLEDEDLDMYLVLGRKLVRIAKQKNPERDYGEIEDIFAER